MKKRNFWAKCIAFLLVVVMVLSEQNITTLGETIGSYAQERMTGSSEQETERAIIKEDSSQESSSADGSSASSSETSQAESSVSKNDSQKTQQTDNNSDAGSAQTDQGTSASSGQQALTDGASDVDNAGAQNEKKTADDKKNNRQNAQKKQKAKTEEQNDANQQEENQDTEKNSASLDDIIRDYYGDVNSTEDGNRPTASVTIRQIGKEEESVKAGSTIDFRVEYFLNRAGNYNYGNQRQPLFDTYEDTQIVMSLPEGISIIDDGGVLANAGITLLSPTKENPNVWILKLSDSIPASSDSTGSFDLTMKINGNGFYGDNHEFDFGNSEDMMKIETWFTIKDRTDSSNVTDKGRFNKIIGTDSKINEDNKLTTETNDVWAIKKSAAEGDPEIVVGDDGQKNVKISFNLEVGLESNGEIINSPSNYGLEGRVPFKNGNDIILTEKTVLYNSDNTTLNETKAEKITITPQFGERSPQVLKIGDNNYNEDGELQVEFSIPVDTCANHAEIADKVDSNAPFYSQYRVDIEYPYDVFVSQYYDDVNIQKGPVVQNTATITYQLKGQQEKTSDSSATKQWSDVTEPAKLVLKKMINGKVYTQGNFGNNDPVKGDVKYSIKKNEQGNTENLIIYQQNADGTYSVLSKDGEVTYAPSENNTTGELIVYLDPGTYTVSEIGLPAYTEKITAGSETAEDKTVTLVAGENEPLIFYNKENLGQIKIIKTGIRNGQKINLPGAKFGIYKDLTCEDPVKDSRDQAITATTDEDGIATFDRLGNGTYYVKELEAPSGYVLDDAVYTLTLDETNREIEQSINNNYSTAEATFKKQIIDVNDSNNPKDLNATNYKIFDGCFTVERQNEDKTWTEVDGYKKFSLDTKGTKKLTLQVYEADGITPIQYRIKEVLPEGWHADNEYSNDKEENGIVYHTFTMAGYLNGTIKDPITMVNTRNGSIALTKDFYTAEKNGMAKNQDTSLTATFELYSITGDATTAVKVDKTLSSVTAGGTINITDLPRTVNGQPIKYYLVETGSSASDYNSSETGGINGAEKTQITVPDANVAGGSRVVQAYGPFDFTEAIDESSEEIVLEQSITITNVENKVPVVVQKFDSYDYANEKETFVPGAKYTIWEYVYDDATRNWEKGTVVINNTEIDSEDGSLAELNPGKQYVIEETYIPEGYKQAGYKNETDNKTGTDNLIIDLRNVTVDKDTDARQIVILNKPDPSFKITKVRDNASGGDTPLTDVQFQIYIKNTKTDKFEPVKKADGSTLTIIAGEALRIEAGTYYLKEKVEDDNSNHILNPSDPKYKDLYVEKKVGEWGTEITNTEEIQNFYFGPYNVKDQQAVQDFEIIKNYADTGAVTVKKYEMKPDGTPGPLDGASIKIEGINGEKKVTDTQPSVNGQVTFTNLPIYDANGKKIEYTITETAAPDGFMKSEQKFTVELQAGETVTTGSTSGKESVDLAFVNQPEMELTVEKVYYNAWEHSFTNKEYPLPGTKIALYRWNKENNQYEFVEMKETADEDTPGQETGTVTFEGLEQNVEYVAVEVSVPDRTEYQYLEPQGPDGGHEYLGIEEETGKPKKTTLTRDELKKYNYVKKEANGTANRPEMSLSGKLVNVENWTQLHIEKFVIEEAGRPGITAGDRRQINNAQFNLYMEVLDDTVNDNSSLSFDYTNTAKYTLIGTYSSGTLYDTEGNRLDGWFGTDILKSADNVVYWLEETNAGIGAAIKPESKYTLIKKKGTGYTNGTTYTIPGEDGEQTVNCSSSILNYINNGVTTGSVQNDPLYDGDGEMYSTVRIAKWAGHRSDDGEKQGIFDPLGNVTFNLYLADKDGNIIEPLDTLTTGLDNKTIGDYEDGSVTADENGGGTQNGNNENVNSPENEETKELTAWASSKAFSWTEISALVNDKAASKRSDIITETADGYYVRVAIQEEEAPSGYMAQKRIYYMYMFFQKKGVEGEPGKIQTTEIFNDAYYVKGDENSADKDEMWAENQNPEVTWALYPTAKGQSGYDSVSGITVPKDATESTKQYRLINWPVDTHAVTVQKYGYEIQEGNGSPGSGNLNMTSEELDTYYSPGSGHTDRNAISVDMKLQRYADGQWTDYNYNNTTETDNEGIFTTNASGYFAFPNGLRMGRYRIIEENATGEAAQYEMIYDGSDLTPDSQDDTPDSPGSAAYYFQVGNNDVHITMYNPKKQDLYIKKTGTDRGTTLSGVEFTLTKTTDSTSITGETGDDGKASLINIGSGTYTLTESIDDKVAPAGYTDSYFKKYFSQAYNKTKGKAGNLVELVGKGIYLGYSKRLELGENGTSVIVTNKTDITDYGITRTDGIDLNIQNPQKVSFTIRKNDADNPATYLNGAKFTVDYIAFDKINGEDITVEETSTWTKVENPAAAGNDKYIWETAGTQNGTPQGTVTITGDPGIYRITEVAPPSDYDLSENPIQYIALTGGLTVGNITVKKKDDQKNISPTGNTVFVDFSNEKQVDLTVTKQIDRGSMEIQGNHKFSFTLYDQDKKSIETKDITVTGTTAGTAIFADLSQNGTYYLKETSTEEEFVLTGMTVKGNTNPLTSDKEGFYKIKIPDTTQGEPAAVEVTAVNKYLKGQISFKKVDGESGEPLKGATFRIVRVNGTQETDVQATITDNQNGSYTAVIPFTGNQEETFRIYETKAPQNYLLNSTSCIEFKMEPGNVLSAPELPEVWVGSKYAMEENTPEQNDQAMLADYIFPNYRGAYINVTKYGNVHDANPEKVLAGMKFTLYKKNEATDTWKEYVQEAATDSNGYVGFVVENGIYALEENLPADSPYQGLEGIYDSNDTKQNIIDAIIEKDNGDKEDTEKKKLHVINGGQEVKQGTTYTYKAYNIPYLSLVIRKENSDTSGSAKRMTATAAVYEVPAETMGSWGNDPEKVTSAQVTEFIAENSDKLLIDNIDVSKVGSTGNAPYSYADKTTNGELDNILVAGKTYLIVEQTAGIVEGQKTVPGSQIRGSEQVQWYHVIQPPAGSTDEQTAVLRNAEGTAPLTLEKAVDKKNYTSLFTEAAEVEYTLTPTVGTNSYPLADFTVNDTGLTAYGDSGELVGYLAGKYSLKQVKLGKASHKANVYSDAGNAPINAIVEFKDNSGVVIYSETVKGVDSISENGSVVTLPEDKGKAAQISVKYESPIFKEATKTTQRDGYALGANFVPGTITITAEIDQQEGGPGKEAITRINNAADSILHYYKWGPDGKEDTALSEEKDSSAADISFSEQKAPIISVTKTSDKTGMVALDSTVEYGITITNNSTEEASMQNPFVVDYLPQGTSWDLDEDSNVDAELEAGDTNLTLRDITTQTVNGEKAVFIFLNGTLDKGESATVNLRVKIDNTVTAYGTTMRNYALVGSDIRGAESKTNPNAASFRNGTGNWAQNVGTLFGSALSEERLNNLKSILGETRKDYGYVTASHDLQWTTATDSVLVKSAYGDRNASQGYTTDILSSVNNIIVGDESSGTMHYRLSVSNTSADYKTTNIVVMDILPAIGDFTRDSERESEWKLTFNAISNVYVSSNPTSKVNYKTYYYTGELSGADAYSNLYQSTLDFSYNGLTDQQKNSGWTDTQPAEQSTIKAFVVVTDSSVQLAEEDTLLIEYTARVKDGKTPWTEQELSNNSWKNAVNSFVCTYSRIENAEGGTSPVTPQPLGRVLESNEVSTTTMPNQVQVGGHIWIDKDGDGIREEGESIDDWTDKNNNGIQDEGEKVFAGNVLIQQMLAEVQVKLTTFRGGSSGSERDYIADGSWSTNANYIFDKLDPAVIRDDINTPEEINERVYPGGILNPGALKGTAPSTYTINVTLPNTVTGIYEITRLGEECGRSNHPDQLSDKEKTDNNFTGTKDDHTGVVSASSERFYLWPTVEEVFDNTKDIGIVPYRNLVINKKAKDGGSDVDGVKFALYGPYDEKTVITQANATSVDTGREVTTENGQAVFDNLYWYKQYVIVEESTADGYTLDDTVASPSAGTNLTPITVKINGEDRPAWILGVPDDEKTSAVDTVTVTNNRIPTTATIKAFKTLKNKKLTKDAYSFCLWNGENGVDSIGKRENLLEIAKNDASGNVSFTSRSFDISKVYTYYITEQMPVDEEGQIQSVSSGVTYDGAIWKVEVNVFWDSGKSQLTNTVTYTKVDKEGTPIIPSVVNNDKAEFTNIYGATGSWTPEGSKMLTGRTMKAEEEYTFSVKKDGTEVVVSTGTAKPVQDVEEGEEVPIEFTPITYQLSDKGQTYTYTIEENKTGTTIPGVSYDKTIYTVEVTVVDNGEGTLVPQVSYIVNGSEKDRADFTNEYVPTPIKYTPHVLKTLTGDALPEVNGEEESNANSKDFTFTLTKGTFSPEDGAVMPSNSECTKTITINKGTDAPASGTATFGEIIFKKAGTYTFTIRETNENDTGVIYDEEPWTLTVTVSDDGKGVLSKQVTYSKQSSGSGQTQETGPAQPTVITDAEKASFTNEYHPVETQEVLKVSKAVTGIVALPNPDGQKFKFQLSLVSGDEDYVTMPAGAGAEVEITVPAVGENHRREGQFGSITFRKAGRYVFEINEISGIIPGYNLMTGATRYALVEVVDKAGQLESNVTYYSTNPENPDRGTTEDGDAGITRSNAGGEISANIDSDASRFTNEYSVTETSFTPKVYKTLTGDKPKVLRNFTFNIEKQSGDDTGVIMPENRTATVLNGSGSGVFETIRFTKADSYTFKITESIPAEAVDKKYQGYTYDDTEWILTVEVKDTGGKLEVIKHTYKADDSTDNGTSRDDAAAFENSYSTKPDTYAPQVKKTITGADIPTGREDEFDFTLTYKDAESAYVGEDVTGSVKYGSDIMAVNDVKNLTMTGSGESSFEELTFTKAGTYTFEIAETSGNQPGYKYDSSKWTLTVNVVDENGELKATPSYTKAGDSSVTHATFINTYSVTPDTFTPQVEKQFSDDSVARPNAKDFTFKLTADEQNPAGGAFTGYDETTGSGTALEGANTIETKVNGSGTGAFDTITFTKAGTYKFRIQEEAGSDLGYTYDDAVWTLTIQVDDIGGALQVTNNDVTNQSNDTTVEPNNEKAVFVNEYHYISSIIINKEVLRGNAVYETDDVFYAGIFRKVDNTGGGTGSETGNISYEIVKNVVVDNKTVESGVVQLANNDSVEVYVPLGGEDQTEAITYYVFETDAEGNPLVSFDEDGNAVYNQPFAYEISSESTGEDGTVNGRGEVYVTPDTAGAHPEVTITNRATSVAIEKRDISGNPLTGAVLELWKQADSVDVGVAADEDRTKAANGDILLETWTSDGTPHELTAELAVGGTYYLREAEVPAGYVQAADILFTVENGDPITLIMEDENQANVLGQIQVTKRLSAIDETTFDNIDLVAEDATVYVGLFTDAQGEHPYGEDYVKEIHIQDASSGTVTFDNLPSGTYYVFETQQDGTVIPYGELQADAAGSGAGFICAGDGSNGGVKEITLNPDTGAPEGSTELGNVYYGDLPDGFAYQGELMITKAVMKDGAPADSSDTFYAGIFTSETETVPYKVVALENNGTVTVEVPLGGENGMDPVTYYIYETDADGNKIDKNSFAYTVSGEGTVDLDVDNTTAGRTIINTMASDPDTTRTIREKNDSDTKKISTDTSKKSTGTNRRTSSSKTGDDTRVGLYLLFFAAAAVGIILTLRKRKEDKPE